MGDASDHADVGRFLRTPEGKKVLDRFTESLVGKSIAGVEYTHYSTGIGIVLSFHDRDLLDLAEAIEAFSVETLRRRYQRLLDREYGIDFPQLNANPSAAENASPVARFVCPECGASEAFCIETWQRLTYYPDGTVTEGDEGQQWDPDSSCCCESCLHEGVVGDFLPDGKP
ncbi:MAG: hypothetical protein GC168_14900 [Candidatus Hydrogenedens sp.]|nr:hypothetical protein [Candidatus Hydrogenedens sp.]